MQLTLLLCIALVLLLYLLTSKIQSNLGKFFLGNIPHDKIVVYILWAIYLPGVIIHEASHLIFAVFLLLRVSSLNLFPSIQHINGKQTVKLGYVTYYKADPIRGLLVGIAPFIIGTLILLILFNKIEFPSASIMQNLFFIYASFVVSSTMFSSKQDLYDLLYVIPTIIIILIIFWLLKFNPLSYISLSVSLQTNGLAFLSKINQIFSISFIINLLIYAIVKLLRKIL